MTIDAGNSLRVIRTIIRTTNEPQIIVSAGAEAKLQGYERRLFLCPPKHVQGTGADRSTGLGTSESVVHPRNPYFVGAEYIQPSETAKGLKFIQPSETAEGLEFIQPSETAEGLKFIQPSETAEGLNVFNPYKAADPSNTFGAGDDAIYPKEFMAKVRFARFENGGRSCILTVKNVEKLCKSLAFMGNIYYNNKLYNVAGSRFMQGFAGLRNVAEVLISNFIYLKTPHIANSKGIIFAP